MIRPYKQYTVDFSLALINKTGAYYICRDLVSGLPQFFVAARYWRLFLHNEPKGLIRKLMARALLFELNNAKLVSTVIPERGPGTPGVPILFLDPLYVLRSRLEPQDIVLCHDIGPISHPELFADRTVVLYKEAYARIQRLKPGMVFVSEASRSEFSKYFGTDFRFLHTILLYVRPDVELGDDRPPPGVSKPFLLTVGALETRKNHCRVIEAFKLSELREQGYTYVFCGPRGNSAQEVEKLAARTEGVQGFGYLSDGEVRWLYRNAVGFVLPSLLEGFGLPALEAAKHGLVSIVSNSGAQRETAGEGAIFVDPMSVDDISNGMRSLVEMPDEDRARRLDKLRKHATELTLDRYLGGWTQLLAKSG